MLAQRACSGEEPIALEKALVGEILDWLRVDLLARGLPVEPDRFRAFEESRLPALRYDVHRVAGEVRTADETEAREQFERLMLRFLDEFLDFLDRNPHCAQERGLFEALVDRDGQDLLACYSAIGSLTTRRHLRHAPGERGHALSGRPVRPGELSSNHRARVDLTDPDSVWSLLVAGARRHERKWDQRGKVRREISYDAPAPGRPRNDQETDSPHDMAETRSSDPIAAFVVKEILILSGVVRPTPAEVDLHMVSPLTTRQRDVIALHLAGLSRNEIATKLTISLAQVDRALHEAREVLRSRLTVA
ncbi:MAG: ECF-type sigma factor [Isosphaeraceae bacterium]